MIKQIVNYEDTYSISEDGKVLNIKSNKYLKPILGNNGYYRVALCVNGIPKAHNIHRLMAEHFINNPYNKEFVNHISGDKTDNSINNLEWVTRNENMQHAFENGLSNVKPNMPVLQLTKSGTLIAKYVSISEACRQLKMHKSNISNVLNGKRKTAGGYLWKEGV